MSNAAYVLSGSTSAGAHIKITYLVQHSLYFTTVTVSALYVDGVYKNTNSSFFPYLDSKTNVPDAEKLVRVVVTGTEIQFMVYGRDYNLGNLTPIWLTAASWLYDSQATGYVEFQGLVLGTQVFEQDVQLGTPPRRVRNMQHKDVTFSRDRAAKHKTVADWRRLS